MLSIEARLNMLSEFISLIEIILDIPTSREWFRSIDLWVMGPARFRCATLLQITPDGTLTHNPWLRRPVTY